MKNNNEFTGFLKHCPFDTDHPEMLIGILASDSRFTKDTDSKQSEYSMNTETWD